MAHERSGIPRLFAPALAWLALTAGPGCSGEEADNKLGLPSGDVVIDAKYTSDAQASPQDVIQDLGEDDLTPDESSEIDDAVPSNTPPQFQPPKALTLAQGEATQIDLNPLIYDAEDQKGALKLSWSAKYVGLKDPGSHVLYVVAPTQWFGSETVDLTLKDQGGLTAVQPLQITITEIKAPPPQPTQDCGQTEFSIAAGTAAKQVLLSGSFNGWAATPEKADVLSDPKGTGTWSVQKKLAVGVYQYKFIVDGKWQADKANPNQTPDGFGGMNSVIEVKPCTP